MENQKFKLSESFQLPNNGIVKILRCNESYDAIVNGKKMPNIIADNFFSYKVSDDGLNWIVCIKDNIIHVWTDKYTEEI